MKYYELRSENLTNLGGPMGSEYTFDNWTKSFSSMAKAKSAAEKDYSKECGGKPWHKIIWSGNKSKTSSQDLNFVQYHIKQITVK